MHNKKKPLT